MAEGVNLFTSGEEEGTEDGEGRSVETQWEKKIDGRKPKMLGTEKCAYGRMEDNQ